MGRVFAIAVLAALVAAVALAATGCGRGEGAKREESGGEPRIVALSPAIAVTLRDLGLGERIVGRHGFDSWTDQRIPVCGDQAGVDAEMLLAVRPTHVLMQGDPPADVVRLAEQHGWLVWSWRLLPLDEVRGSVVDLSALFKDEIEAGRGAELLEAFDRALPPEGGRSGDSAAPTGAAPVGGTRPPRVLLMMGVDPPTVLGPGSFHHQMLERLGGVPAMEEGGRYMLLSAEDVLGVNPEAIILFRPAGGGEVDSADLSGEGVAALGPLAKLDIAAARSGRVAVIDDPLGFVPGTNLIPLAEEMKRVLDRWTP
jgi:ABC-type hemin transport system substrate-binding protein